MTKPYRFYFDMYWWLGIILIILFYSSVVKYDDQEREALKQSELNKKGFIIESEEVYGE